MITFVKMDLPHDKTTHVYRDESEIGYIGIDLCKNVHLTLFTSIFVHELEIILSEMKKINNQDDLT